MTDITTMTLTIVITSCRKRTLNWGHFWEFLYHACKISWELFSIFGFHGKYLFYDYLPVGSYASCHLNFICFIYEIHKDA
jgi:hypothetical protein